MTQTMINGALCIELAIIFALAFAWNCTASYARHLEKRIKALQRDLAEAFRLAAFWQQQAGDNAQQLHEAWGMTDHWRIECELAEVDAAKWRLAREARRRNRAHRHGTLKAQTTAALREGG